MVCYLVIVIVEIEMIIVDVKYLNKIFYFLCGCWCLIKFYIIKFCRWGIFDYIIIKKNIFWIKVKYIVVKMLKIVKNIIEDFLKCCYICVYIKYDM